MTNAKEILEACGRLEMACAEYDMPDGGDTPRANVETKDLRLLIDLAKGVCPRPIEEAPEKEWHVCFYSRAIIEATPKWNWPDDNKIPTTQILIRNGDTWFDEQTDVVTPHAAFPISALPLPGDEK